MSDYWVTTWSIPDAEAEPSSGLWSLALAETPSAAVLAPELRDIYYGTLTPDGTAALLLQNAPGNHAMRRVVVDAGGHVQASPAWTSGGRGGSYIAYDPGGGVFIVSNSGDGWAIFREGPTPTLISSFSHEGGGPHPRQPSSHPHCAVFIDGGAGVFAADMGADAILHVSFDAVGGRHEGPMVVHRSAPGSGPRHLIVGGSWVYVVNELSNSVDVLERSDDGVRHVQHVSTLPPGWSGESFASHVALDPERATLYVANRGHDSICAYRVDSSGRLSGPRWVPSGGRWPWFFLIDGDRMLVCNNLSDSVAVFELDSLGDLHPVARVQVPRPVFLLRTPTPAGVEGSPAIA